MLTLIHGFAFGMGRSFKYISINKIRPALGEQKSHFLPVFHAFSGCDTTSAFNGKGKRSAWQAWELCSHTMTPSLEFLSTHPFQQLDVDSERFRNLERLVSLRQTFPSLALNFSKIPA